jgi:Domain of unknown function (DUF4394)
VRRFRILVDHGDFSLKALQELSDLIKLIVQQISPKRVSPSPTRFDIYMKIWPTVFTFLFSLAVSSCARAELILAVTSARNLVTFDSASPGTILSSVAITGTQDLFESISSIDFRPSTGALYALGNAPGSIYRLYTLNATTGALTKVGADISGTIGGSFQGFDFDPSLDVLRIITESDQNFRFNPTTGALISTDSNLAYAAGDSGAGANPNVVGSAYNNNIAGAATTTLFNIDSARDALVIQNPPNNGTLTTVGFLGVDFQNFVGFEVSGASGAAYATSVNSGLTQTNLYSINLTTGAASPLGQVGNNLVINDIAVSFVAVPEPSSFTLLSICAMLIVGASRNRSTSRQA